MNPTPPLLNGHLKEPLNPIDVIGFKASYPTPLIRLAGNFPHLPILTITSPGSY